jgi:hypothetical protein
MAQLVRTSLVLSLHSADQLLAQLHLPGKRLASVPHLPQLRRGRGAIALLEDRVRTVTATAGGQWQAP